MVKKTTHKVTQKQLDNLRQSLKKGLSVFFSTPPQRLSQWADREFYLSAESSYTEGNWACYPWQVAILDCMANDDIETLVMRKSTRVGYTKMVLAYMAYTAKERRRSQVHFSPTDDDRDIFVKAELNPMLRDVKPMAEVFPWEGKRHSNNTLMQKVMLGSIMHLRSGTSGTGYRALTVDSAVLDEVDAFPRDVDNEGDPKKLAYQRISGSVHKKQILGSTPKIKFESLIDDYAEECSRDFRYYVPCRSKDCGQLFVMSWDRFLFDSALIKRKKETTSASHVKVACPVCGETMTQAQYLRVWHKGRWVDTEEEVYIDSDSDFRLMEDDKKVRPPGSLAFHIWTAYAPLETWAKIAQDSVAAKGDTSKTKTFINTTLGTSFENKDEQRSPDIILARREAYRAEVPLEGIYLTAGIDTQDDRFEMYVHAWSGDNPDENWHIDCVVIEGDPELKETQTLLDKALQQTYLHESGVRLPISAAAVDTGGHRMNAVYRFCYGKESRKVYAIKGLGGEVQEVGKRSKQNVDSRTQHKITLHFLGVDSIKQKLFDQLATEVPGPNYQHIPLNNPFYGPEFATQLCGEAKRTKTVKGLARVSFVPIRQRVEALDCWVYSYGAFKMSRPDLAEIKNKVSNAAKWAEDYDPGHTRQVKRRKSKYL